MKIDDYKKIYKEISGQLRLITVLKIAWMNIGGKAKIFSSQKALKI